MPATAPCVHAIAVRSRIALEPGDTLEQVRAKEHAFAALTSRHPRSSSGRRCATAGVPPGSRITATCERTVPFAALADQILGRGTLSERVAAPMIRRLQERSRRASASSTGRSSFPKSSSGGGNDARATAGFDAIVGNPPWEMLRGDRGDARDSAGSANRRSTTDRFCQRFGSLPAPGQRPRQPLSIVPRAIAGARPRRRPDRPRAAVRPGHRHGSGGLRRTLFDHTHIDSLVSLENRDGLFPVHRSLRILLLSATEGERTVTLPCRFGIGARRGSRPVTGERSQTQTP